MTNKEDVISEFHTIMKQEGHTTRKEQSKEIAQIFIDVLSNRIGEGHTVNIPEIGIFESKLRRYKNKLIGDKPIERFTLNFRISKRLKRALNKSMNG